MKTSFIARVPRNFVAGNADRFYFSLVNLIEKIGKLISLARGSAGNSGAIMAAAAKTIRR
jgi:hypothetical protein